MTPVEKIRERIGKLEAIETTYREYMQHRVDEDDLHGTWDAAINIAETASELAGLRFALLALDEQDPPGDSEKPARRA